MARSVVNGNLRRLALTKSPIFNGCSSGSIGFTGELW
jgi:hypothetical protein